MIATMVAIAFMRNITAKQPTVPNKENTDEKYPILSISPTEVNKAILSII